MMAYLNILYMTNTNIRPDGRADGHKVHPYSNPDPYVSITGNRWTKHYYIGSERIASRTGTLGDFAALHTPDNHSAGNGQVASVNYAAIRMAEEDSIASYYAQLGVPYEVQRNTRGSGVHLYLPTSLPDDNRSTSTASEYASSERDRDSLRNTSTTLDEGQVYYYHRDPLGSTLSISDSVGTLVQQVEYTPWGKVFVELRCDSTFTTPYLFNGKELDEETGLYYYGARYYDPKLCVWYGVDPLALKNGLGYPYVMNYNNPLRFIDSNGRKPEPAEAARIAAHVYGDKTDDILIGGWRVSHRNFKEDLGLRDAAGLKSMVYEKVVNGIVTEYVYATAGTDDWRDCLEDFLQPFGLSEQYHIAAENAKKISKELGNKELSYVGHSLGGGEAALNSLLTYGQGKGRKAFTFNAAGVSDVTKILEGSLKTLFQSENSIEAYILRTDPLNMIQNKNKLMPDVNGNKHYLWPKDFKSLYNGQSIDNILKNFGVSNPKQYDK
ncbi:MAG: hypothetical protein J5529_01675 [Prevotella sp.]|nr:hypothetical protein [Prevotella sp.]